MKTRKQVDNWVHDIQELVAKPLGFCNIPWWDNDHNPVECPNCDPDWKAWQKFWSIVKKGQEKRITK